MYLGLGFLLLSLWVGGFFVFHITAFFGYTLLILAVVSLALHFIPHTAATH